METLDKIPQRDPTVMALAFRKPRVYLLSKREPEDVEEAALGRDVFNEKPILQDIAEADYRGANSMPKGAVLHTTKGDITLKLFPDECPKTIENFTTHAKNRQVWISILHYMICYHSSTILI